MKIFTFSINGDGSTRRMCVVNGQAFYESSGTSSDLPWVWVLFMGVLDDRFSAFTGMIQKPSVTNNKRAKIGDYFPSEVAEVIKLHMLKAKEWGRLHNINCLIISCMLSPEAIPPEIKAAVLKYIEPRQPLKQGYGANPYNCATLVSRILKEGGMSVQESNTPWGQSPNGLAEQLSKMNP